MYSEREQTFGEASATNNVLRLRRRLASDEFR
jgi:hypothetical protein